MALRRLIFLALIAAVAFVAMCFRTPLPPLPPFLRYDPSDIAAILATFAFGAWPGVLVQAMKNLLSFLIRGSHPVSLFMNFLAGSSLVLTAGLLAPPGSSPRRAAAGLAAGTAAMAAVMAVANVAILPLYYGMPRGAVVSALMTAYVPFNVIKGTLSSVAAYLLYLKLGPVLARHG